MPGTNDFLPFATADGANVESQVAYAADPQTASGFIGPSIAQSQKLNKVWRQSASIAAMIAGWIVGIKPTLDMIDNGDLATMIANFTASIKALAWTGAVLTTGSVAVTQTPGDNTTKIATDAFVQAAINALDTDLSAQLTPVGSVILWTKNTPPTNYLEMNGASLSTATYADLFAVIRYTFGGAGGSFNLPDMRGQFARGWDHSAGVDPGRSFGSGQTDSFAAHTHEVGFGNDNSPSDKPGHGGGGAQTETSESTGGSETRPVNVALMYCIKYQ